MSPNSRARCARFFKNCLDFLDEPDHLVVRAFAHEQFARLLLNYDEELDLTSEALPVESEVSIADAEGESFDFFGSMSDAIAHEMIYYPVGEDEPEPTKDEETSQDSGSEVSRKLTLDANVSACGTLIALRETDLGDPGVKTSPGAENFAVGKMSTTAADMVQTVGDPISSKLAAVHHVSQAIKSLRWKRQLQSTEPELDRGCGTQDRAPSSMDFFVCACGDADCIEVCDIRQWLPTSKLDDKLWKLVLLLGESYLALGQAYKDNYQLHQALKVVELACLVYGSMPQHLEDTTFISSMVCNSPSKMEINDRSDKAKSFIGDASKLNSCSNDDCLTLEQFSSTYLFWAKAWTLVGDVYVEFHMIKGKEIALQAEKEPFTRGLRMSSEVLKEVKRLKKKLGEFNQNCSSCSLVNCSCQSDRSSSGSSASSSTGDSLPLGYGRKQSKKSYVKSSPYSLLGNPKDDSAHHKVETRKSSESGYLKHNRSGDTPKETSNVVTDVPVEKAATVSKRVESPMEMHNVGPTVATQSDTSSRETTKVKNGGIFKYLGDPLIGDAEYNLSAALSCYEEARKALGGHPSGSVELQSVAKKKGWVCNELGRKRLERKELDKAELAFADAIKSFKEVSDHTNIILINCNLGHGRRALAEEMVSKTESLRKHAIFRNAYNQALETAKLEYSESLKYYGAAKTELNAITEEVGSVLSSLRNEVYTQFANTYLRLGMLLAREDTIAEVYENGALEDFTSHSMRRAKKELRKHEISANDAIREALSLYESLGELRKQEAAYAYFQLACYQRDCCLKFLEPDQKKINLSKGENSNFQRVKQYGSLAERNWQKSMDFYGPKTHPMMYLTILIERSALSISLSSSFHSNVMLESALARLLEGHHVSERTSSDSLRNDNPEVCSKFWDQLQMLLKRMLATTLSANTNKSSHNSQQTPSNRSGDVGKLRELYKMSLKSTDFSQLCAMHSLWTS
uniref:Uncharacterized protein n=1 Tax=Davidia involucrata TaxID=16924 RepID=A0A5B7A8Y3_DAVIN